MNIIDHYLPLMIERAKKVGYYGENTPLTDRAQLERLAIAAQKAAEHTTLQLAHYAEILQYSLAALRYGHKTVEGYLVWLALQPIITDKPSEFGMLPDRANRIIEAYK